MALDFFDRLIIISLPHRTDRREAITAEMVKYQIPYEIFDAIPHEKGLVGLLHTMKAVFKYALRERISRLWVCEDDASFLLDPINFFEAIKPQIPKHYHCFYMGQNLISKPDRISENVFRINGAYSTHSILYSKEGMEIVLSELDKNEEIPYDILLMQRLQPLHRCFGLYPMLMTQRLSYSDIEKRGDADWGNLMATTFRMHTKNLQMSETIPCQNGHTWGGIFPTVDVNNLTPQYEQLWGQPCDCGRMKIAGENQCGCSPPRWEVQIFENR